MGVAVKRLRIGRRREREVPKSPLELAHAPALVDGRWSVPSRFNFARDVVAALAADPKRRALTFLGRDGVIQPRSFVELADGATRWAHVLRERGVQPGDRVVLLLDTNADWLQLVLACFKLGAVASPCSPQLSVEALDVRIAASGPALVVASRACEHELARLPYAPEVHFLGDGYLRRAADTAEDVPAEETAARDLAVLVWTAGTEGGAKPVAHTHGATFAARVAAEHWLDLGPGDAVWCTADAGSAQSLWTALGAWARRAEVLLSEERLEPLDRLDVLHRLGATVLCQTPAEYRALAEVRELPRFRSPRLRRLVSVGDRLEAEVAAAFEEAWGLTIHEAYGQAETGVVVANGAASRFEHGSLGLPLPGHQVAVVDRQGNELPPGVEGDLALRGRPPTLFAGYWESPEETKDAFRGDWYVTGDVARMDENGFLWFVGRREDVIDGRGVTFGPYGIERALRAHDAVAAAAAVGIRDLERGGHFVRAFVTVRPGVEGSEQLEAELRQFVSDALPEHEIPREIEFVDALPVSASGSARRADLRARPVAGRPLWDLPPTTEPEPPAVAAAPEPTPLAAPTHASDLGDPATPAAYVEQGPPAKPEPAPEPVAEPHFEPEARGEPEALVVPEGPPDPEPAPEAAAAPALDPESVAEPPAQAGEEAAVVPDEPPVTEEPPPPEPAQDVIPEYVVDPAAAPSPVGPAREQHPAGHEPLPEYVVDPGTAPAPGPAVREPDPEPEADPGPLPDYVVDPGRAPLEPAALGPPAPPEPEAEEDLGPLPEYVVDPDRPHAGPALASGSAEAEQAAFAAALGIRPAAFPFRPDASSAEEEDEPRARTPRPRPAPEVPPKTKARRGHAEPGDEAEEVGWMKGLSNRLRGYSLAREDARPRDDDGEPGDGEA
jgi:acetyl-CoA synthetase/medium-chain acyl-CoA synthetase